MFQAAGGKMLLNGEKYSWRGYTCGTYHHRGTCKHNGKKQDVIDRYVLNEVLKLSNDVSRKAFYKKLSENKQKDLKSILKAKKLRLHSLKQEFERVSEAYRTGIDSINEYAKNKMSILPQIDNIQKDIVDIEKKIIENPNFTWKSEYAHALSKFLNQPNENDKKTVKRILNKLIERVEVRSKPLYIKIYFRES